MTLKRLILVLSALGASLAVVSAPATTMAYSAGQFRFSGLAGQVGLLGDPGASGANALGYGLSAAYQLDEKLALEIRYLGSRQPDVNHRDVSVGAEYYFSDYVNAYPHAEAGMSFLNNEFKSGKISGDAVGIYVGGGLAFEISRQLQVGPEVRFVKAFASQGVVSGKNINTVGDSYSLLLRIQYILGAD